MQNVSASGLKVRIVAIPTFVAGFDVTQFADDGDPVGSGSVTIAETGMAINGDLVVWQVPNPITLTLNVLPNTDEAKNLEILWTTNRTSKGKLSIADNITAVVTYPNGDRKVLTNGAITSGPAITSATSGARLSTKEYTFAFETCI